MKKTLLLSIFLMTFLAQFTLTSPTSLNNSCGCGGCGDTDKKN